MRERDKGKTPEYTGPGSISMVAYEALQGLHEGGQPGRKRRTSGRAKKSSRG